MRLKLLLIIAIVISSMHLKAQDIIYLKNRSSLKTKISEVSPKFIKFQKNENLDGPIYSINTNEIIYIQYQNGTIDIFDQSFYKTIVSKNQLTQTTNHLSLSPPELIDIKKPEGINSLNQIKSDSELSNSADSIVTLKDKVEEELAILKNKKINETVGQVVQNKIKKNILENDISKFKTKYSSRNVYYWISALLFTSVGVFSTIQSNSLYGDYRVATTNAYSLHSTISTYNALIPIAYTFAGISTVGLVINMKNDKKARVKLKNEISINPISIKYSF